MPDLSNSSVLSSHKKVYVRHRMGEVCILCGCPSSIDVAHILARNAHGNAKLDELWKWSIQLDGFNPENLVCFCATHHRQYISGEITIVPSFAVRQRMIEQEIQDFQRRQLAVSQGQPDPGRILLMPPELTAEFEYVPVEVPLYFQCHTSSPLHPHTFMFNSQDIEQYPLRRWDISIYAVLMAASQPLASPARILSPRSDAAERDVRLLIQLYRRQIAPPSLPITISPQEWPQIRDFLAAAERMPPVWNTTTRVQESPGEATTGATPDLLTYEDEQIVTPAVLSSRTHWRPTESKYGDEGSMRFATSSDFVINSNELRE